MPATILASGSNIHNPFSSLPSTPPPPRTQTHQLHSHSSPFPPPIPIPKYPPKPQKTQHTPLPKAPTSNPKKIQTFTKLTPFRTKYYKPISPNGERITKNDQRAITIGENGVSYHLPGAPFGFQFSYSETPKAKPIAVREPAFLPFAPPSMPRPWTGKAPLKSRKEKLLKKKVPLYESFDGGDGDSNSKKLMMGRKVDFSVLPMRVRDRDEVLGEPLSKAEIMALVKPIVSDNRQVNLGRDGLTHNMLELIHSHWRRSEVCKVKCKGVPTVDMYNICRCLEERTGGKIIHKAGGAIYLFRGRNYEYKSRPRYPVMLWKPASPVYPKLIQDAPGGLTKQEADELRRKGKTLLPIRKLGKNGVYNTLVKDVRLAFEASLLVKIDCRGLDNSDYKKIGAKLKDLVPCVLLSFDDEQILMWRGRDWKPMYPDQPAMLLPTATAEAQGSSDDDLPGPGTNNVISPRMMSLWKRAIDSNKAVVLDQLDLGPDDLLKKVEEFDSLIQAAEQSYALRSLPEGEAFEEEEEYNKLSNDEDENEFEYFGDDPFEEAEPPGPLGSLPVDHLAKRLRNL